MHRILQNKWEELFLGIIKSRISEFRIFRLDTMIYGCWLKIRILILCQGPLKSDVAGEENPYPLVLL